MNPGLGIRPDRARVDLEINLGWGIVRDLEINLVGGLGKHNQRLWFPFAAGGSGQTEVE
jgi:hypothetical protein